MNFKLQITFLLFISPFLLKPFSVIQEDIRLEARLAYLLKSVKYLPQKHKSLILIESQGCGPGRGSVAKSAGCSSKEPSFDSQFTR